MSVKQIGKLQPRHRFILNPHSELRLSRCPTCKKPTYPRKFPLFIHIDNWGAMVLGKTCKYCSRCDLIMCHQDELDAELFRVFNDADPKVIGNDYTVIGTVDRKVWKAGLSAPLMESALDHLADFRRYRTLDYDPGGWHLETDPPGKRIIKGIDAAASRKTLWTTTPRPQL